MILGCLNRDVVSLVSGIGDTDIRQLHPGPHFRIDIGKLHGVPKGTTKIISFFKMKNMSYNDELKGFTCLAY